MTIPKIMDDLRRIYQNSTHQAIKRKRLIPSLITHKLRLAEINLERNHLNVLGLLKAKNPI